MFYKYSWPFTPQNKWKDNVKSKNTSVTGLKKHEIPLALQTSSFQIVLPWTSRSLLFLFSVQITRVIPCSLGKWEKKLTCPVGKSTCLGRPEGTCLTPTYSVILIFIYFLFKFFLQLVLPEYGIHLFISLLLLAGGQWTAFLFNLPLIIYNIHR